MVPASPKLWKGGTYPAGGVFVHGEQRGEVLHIGDEVTGERGTALGRASEPEVKRIAAVERMGR